MLGALRYLEMCIRSRTTTEIVIAIFLCSNRLRTRAIVEISPQLNFLRFPLQSHREVLHRLPTRQSIPQPLGPGSSANPRVAVLVAEPHHRLRRLYRLLSARAIEPRLGTSLGTTQLQVSCSEPVGVDRFFDPRDDVLYLILLQPLSVTGEGVDLLHQLGVGFGHVWLREVKCVDGQCGRLFNE